MEKEVVKEVLEVVECKIYGKIPVAYCIYFCPYFRGFTGFKKIKCKKG